MTRHRDLFRNVLLALSLLFASNASAGPDSNPRIAPPESHPRGQSYADWAAAYLQWALSIPQDNHFWMPDSSDDLLVEAQTGPVWFLTGSIFPGLTVRNIEVPPGTPLFVAIDEGWFWIQFPGDPIVPVDEIRGMLAELEDLNVPSCEINGQPVTNLADYRVQTSVFDLSLPNGGFFLDPGDYSPCLGDGYYIFLHPFPVGKHTIHWTTTWPDGTRYETLINLTVNPGKAK